jgi:ABC-2 type transport system permease protein
MDVRDMPLAVSDQDRTVESRLLVEGFLRSGSFAAAGSFADAAAAEESISLGKASLALVIPPGYGKAVSRSSGGAPPSLQLLADGSESQSAAIGLTHAALIVSAVFSKQVESPLAGLDPAMRARLRIINVEPKIRVLYNPTLASRNFMVPGVLAMILMVVTIVLTSVSIVKEKELGTLEQLNVTPITPGQLIVGKLAPFAVLSIVIISLVLGSSLLLFGIAVRGSILVLYALSLLFMLTTLGLGLFISTIAGSQQQAMMLAIFFFILPMVILSGFVFPIESMPPVIGYVTYAFPLRYYFIIIRALFLKGAGLSELWQESAAMLAIGVAVTGASVLRFHKRLK